MVNTNLMDLETVTTQPVSFNPTCLDADSLKIYNNLTTTHKTGAKITSEVNKAGRQLLTDVPQQASTRGHLTYDELSKLVLQKNERFISTDHLEFESLTIYDDGFNVKQTKREGRAILTDKRILLISSAYEEKFAVSQYGNPTIADGGYRVSAEYTNSTYFLPLPLHFFRSIEVEGNIRASGSIDIDKEISVCKCCLCGSCCGLCGSSTSWIMKALDLSETNQTNITFGLLMPPWEKKSFLRLYLGKDAQIQHVYNMLACFQEAMPNVK